MRRYNNSPTTWSTRLNYSTWALLGHYLGTTLVLLSGRWLLTHGVHVAVLELDLGIILKDALHQPIVLPARVHRVENIRQPANYNKQTDMNGINYEFTGPTRGPVNHHPDDNQLKSAPAARIQVVQFIRLIIFQNRIDVVGS